MSQFNTSKWFKTQYLKEANLYEEKSDLAAKAIDQAIAGVDESLSYSDFAKAVATILKNEYGVQNYDKFMEVLHSELGMNEEISDYEMVLYKVSGATSDLDEGGPDESFDIEVKLINQKNKEVWVMEVKLEASLSDAEVKSAIRDAARREQGKLYKLDYKKA